LVLLLVLAGFLANYFAIIHLTAIPDLLGLGPKQVVQAPIPRKQPAKPPEKIRSAPKQPQAQETISSPAPESSAQPPSAPSQEEKLVEIETPTTTAQSTPAKEQIEEKASSVAQQVQTSPPLVAATEAPQSSPSQPRVSEKPSGPRTIPSKPTSPQYPYSVYLGSFKTADAVNKAISDFQEKGLSTYWTRVDLGDKGVWYRFFTGYFRTKEEAAKYISEHNIHGAEPGITKYANLIGTYASEKEAENEKPRLVSAGFCPYLVKNDEGSIYVLSGAFDRKEYAENGRAMLASKGIKSETIER
jgi:cell division protein FtsN